VSAPSRRRRSATTAAIVCAACGLLAREAHSAAPAHVVIDRTVVRFYAPETGGAAYPRFILERVLAFEARLAKMAESPEGVGELYGDRDVRDALDHHVAEEILSSLADKLIADMPPDKRPTAGDLAIVERDVSSAFVERVGGRERIDAAARAEQIDRPEVEGILRRGALAAWYVDRAVTPLLHASEEQLRDVFRSSAHPYRGQSFDQARAALERWFVSERVRVAESAFLQAARSRVRIIPTP
jgi:hypothetical protein